MAEYKIQLGVKVNTGDIQSQINKSIRNAQFRKVKIELNTKRLESQLNSIRKQIQGLSRIKVNLNTGLGSGAGVGGTVNNVNKSVNELTTAYNKLKNISKNIGSIKIKLSSGLNTSKDVQQIHILEKQLKSLTVEYHNTVSKIKSKGNLSSTQWQTIQQQIDNTRLKLEQLSGKLTDAKTKLSSSIKLKIADGTFANDISNIESKFNSLSNKSKDLSIKINDVKQALTAMKMAANNGNIEALIQANKRYNYALKNVENQLRINARVEQKENNNASLNQAKQKLALDMTNWLKNNSAAAKQFGAEIQKLQSKISSCDKTGLSNLRAQFNNITRQATIAGKAAQTLGDKLKTQFSKYSSYFSVASAFMYARMALTSMFRQVVAVDTAMTELKKVTDETNESYDRFLTKAASRAKEIGTTIDGLVQSTAGFARLGYGFEESQGLAEVANIYAVVGDEVEGVEGATKSLISTMAAFREQANGMSSDDFALSIVDKFNEIGNNFAISSGGIGEAMKRSASSLAAANNTLDESIALITAANTVVQNPEKVGRLLPT